MIDISIIIVNYNTFQLTKQCIESIRKQTRFRTNEIIIVDNASADHPVEDFTNLFPDLILIRSEVNLGFAKGNNLGIAKAKGQYILLLNSDTVLQNDAIAITKTFLDTHPQVAVATARLEHQDGRIQHNCQRFPSVRYQLFELLRLQKIFPSKKKILFGPYFNYDTVAYPDWAWGTFFMFRRDLLEKLPEKKLADDFFMYVEDMQWCMEFRKLGYEVAFVPQAKVVHLMGASGGKKNVLMAQNMNIFMTRYYSAWRRIIIKVLNLMLTSRYAT